MIKLILTPITFLLDTLTLGIADILSLILWDIKYMKELEPFQWTKLLWARNKN